MRTETKKYHQHIPLCAQSGMNKAEYCRRNNLSYKSFLYQQSRIIKSKVKGEFVELNLEQSKALDTLEFHYSDGNHFIFPKGSSAKFIREVLFG